MQSPISIDTCDVISMHYPSFECINYNKEYEAWLTYTENSINIKLVPDSNNVVPSLYGGGLFSEYILSDIDYHWNSEHEIDAHRFALECQLVHYARKFGDLSTAKQYKDGIAILVTLYDMHYGKKQKDNTALETLLSIIPDGKWKIGQSVKLDRPIIPRNFLPVKIEKYYHYHGSLTSEPFDEVVTWTIFSIPCCISEKQICELTKTWRKLRKPLKESWRELQNLNDRRVYLSKI